ncbi:hypothetical protein ROHU_022129 [Labeo rohita]|uniref:Uncharacterized protein n=1 Tax=Labeo rohita TaxID=84645 RepID=A0A498MYR0_LABRO|nr:hypothetical protein ROHU_022129 [Labeo rohita]
MEPAAADASLKHGTWDSAFVIERAYGNDGWMDEVYIGGVDLSMAYGETRAQNYKIMSRSAWENGKE